MNPDFVTVYRVSLQFSDLQFALSGGILFLLGAVLLWARCRFPWPRLQEINRALPIGFCGFGLFWMALLIPILLVPYEHALNALQRGEFYVVQGIVTNFDPMPYGGHKNECFTVQDQQFCYSDFDITPGFHQSASHGGPIHEGLPVRVYYRNGMILQLQIPRDQALTPAQSSAIASAGEKAMNTQANAEPFVQNIERSFVFVITLWTLWWNLQWKRVMRFWIKPPYHPWTEIGFRVFFAANFIGALNQLIHSLRAHPLNNQNLVPTLKITAPLAAFIGLGSLLSLTMAERRDRKNAARAVATSSN